MSVSANTISVIGLGYIGLPTAAMFALSGARVIGVDINPLAVDTINTGEIHIVEPGLGPLVRRAVASGSLRATARPEPADAFLIAVPTPVQKDHAPDMAYVKAAAYSIAPVLKKGDIVILESTSPVGSTEDLAQWLSQARPELRFPLPGCIGPDVHIAYCPERVLPGQTIHELVENDRIIGGLTEDCASKAAAIYRRFVRGALHLTDARTAEMCKLTENAYRDVNIAFANELSLISDRLGINVWELIRLANRHPRVNILQPGAGVGGHCIAVDPWFIVNTAPEEARLVRTAREVNDYKPAWVLQKIENLVKSLVSGGKAENAITVAMLGLSFKPDIDDLRESPALAITREFAQRTKARVLAVEPHITSLPHNMSSSTLATMDQAISQADIVVLLVKHRQFLGMQKKLAPHVLFLDIVNAGAPVEPVEITAPGPSRLQQPFLAEIRAA